MAAYVLPMMMIDDDDAVIFLVVVVVYSYSCIIPIIILGIGINIIFFF